MAMSLKKSKIEVQTDHLQPWRNRTVKTALKSIQSKLRFKWLTEIV